MNTVVGTIFAIVAYVGSILIAFILGMVCTYFKYELDEFDDEDDDFDEDDEDDEIEPNEDDL